MGVQHVIVSEIVRADTLRGFRELAHELGGDGDVLLKDAGIDPAGLKDSDSYIPYRRVIAVIERAADVLNCPDFGMRLGERSTADVLGPLSVAMHHAPNAREALALAQRYMHFHNPALFLSVSRLDGEDDFVRLDLRMRGAERHPQPSERGVVVLNRFLTTLCGAAYKPKEVCFVHEPVSPLPVYRAMFGIVPHFGAPESGIAVARALLDRPQLNHNAQLRRIAEHYLETVAPRPPEGDAIAGSARAVVLRFMRAGGCTQEDLANALGLHERTLQRRLKAEDTSFEALRDDVRRELAQSYLAQKDVPLSHIAEMLGYAESSAFTRAARRWFGETPRDVRRRMTG